MLFKTIRLQNNSAKQTRYSNISDALEIAMQELTERKA